ncbi:MAG: cytidyltransferase [Bdellovibrionaceae bacterium]|nr:cytidyltransferase [Pseudobdellovibrionaceae bacterium]|tara:strand:- start:439 stop:1140 length:702 start_codon:yes stop_codon:yes gene_type:complete
MKEVIFMIPARLGSKRVPKKNIRVLVDKPLLQYPIDLCKKVLPSENIYVNSESEVLGQLALASGVKFHKRPEELSTDTATNQDFTREFLEVNPCDFVVMVNPTSPLLTETTLRNFIEFLEATDADTVMSTVDERAECFYEDKNLNFSLSEKINSQDLEPVRKIVWAITAWRRESFLKACNRGECGVFNGTLRYFSIPKDEACDIDTEEDWKIAEALVRAQQSKSFVPTYWSPK